jgi:hypothetical protein
MRRIILLTAGLFVMMGLIAAGHAPRADGQDDLLKVRESVWRLVCKRYEGAARASPAGHDCD